MLTDKREKRWKMKLPSAVRYRGFPGEPDWGGIRN